MMMYLLLRNNKQSGPYSLDELRTMGLKAYDLVWVDGKSAAWRYPCEIDELSAFAPAVEEQPFDRFFKKTSPVQGEPSTVPGKRIIYVTMPAGNGQNRTTPVRNDRSSRFEPAQVTPAPMQAIHPLEPTSVEFEFADNSAQRQQAEAHPVEFVPRPERRRSNLLLKPLIIGLALLAAGIFIGLSINKDTLSFRPKIKSGSGSPDNGQENHTIVQQLPVSPLKEDPLPVVNTNPRIDDQQSDTAATIIGQASSSKPIDQTSLSKPVGETNPSKSVGETNLSEPVVSRGAVERPGKTGVRKAKPANNNTRPQVLSASQATDSASDGLSVVHRETVHRADAEEKPGTGADKEANTRANITSQVSIGANAYTVGAFGGINDLQVTVSNRSVYPLDLVVVEVQYIQANKKIYKTENLYFRGIGAGSALMLEAPKSSRGIKVSYKITMINSKELGLSYSGI
jgi:hypothetical protein